MPFVSVFRVSAIWFGNSVTGTHHLLFFFSLHKLHGLFMAWAVGALLFLSYCVQVDEFLWTKKKNGFSFPIFFLWIFLWFFITLHDSSSFFIKFRWIFLINSTCLLFSKQSLYSFCLCHWEAKRAIWLYPNFHKCSAVYCAVNLISCQLINTDECVCIKVSLLSKTIFAAGSTIIYLWIWNAQTIPHQLKQPAKKLPSPRHINWCTNLWVHFKLWGKLIE